MSAGTYVDEAKSWADKMVARESRGPGDTDNAMRRLQYKYGVSFNDLWRLRYRPPKRIWTDVYERIRQAYEAQRQEQIRRLKHEIAITEKITGADNASVHAAKALVVEDLEET